MKNKIIYIGFFLIIFQNAFAQKEKIEAAKIAFIREKIELTKEQEVVFWPLYNEYTDQKHAIRKQIKLLRIENAKLTSTDEQLKADIGKYFDLRQKELDLEKESYTKFAKVITIRQIVELQNAEKQFTLMLVKKLEEGK